MIVSLTNGRSGYSGSSGAQGVSGYSGYSGPGADQSLNTTSDVTFHDTTISHNLIVGTSVRFSSFGNGTSVQQLNVSPGGDLFPSSSGGTSGYSGAAGVSGYSGASASSGYSGKSGYSGISGFSGYSGTSGFSGYSGKSGYSGVSGFSGASGTSGASGVSPSLASVTTVYDGDSSIAVDGTTRRLMGGAGDVIKADWSGTNNGVTFSNSGIGFPNVLNLFDGDASGVIAINYNSNELSFTNSYSGGDRSYSFDAPLYIIDSITVSGGGGTNSSLSADGNLILNVDSNISSDGNNITLNGWGHTPLNVDVFNNAVIISYLGGSGDKVVGVHDDGTLYATTGGGGASGYSGAMGASGYSGKSGYSGISGFSGYSGASGVSGFSGYSGKSGYSGISGFSGYSGISGVSGYSGATSTSGYSGYSGKSGYSGYSGIAPNPFIQTVQTQSISSGTCTIDLSTGNVHDITATGNFTLAFSNGTNGEKILIRVWGNGTAVTITAGTNVRFGSTLTGFSTVASGKTDYIAAVHSTLGSVTKLDIVSQTQGY